MFSSYTSVDNIFIKFPNSQRILITHIDNVHLSLTFVLKNVLFTLQLSINLISISQLLRSSHCSLLFYNNLCIIRDVPS